MIYIREIILMTYLTMLRIPDSKPQNTDSPCPTVFQYMYKPDVGLYGEISIIVYPTNYLQLNVEMSIGNAVVGMGKLELAQPKEVTNNIKNHQPLHYYLFFPAWTNIPPKITKILVNGNLICSGSRIPVNLVPITTTVNLVHTLKINIHPLSTANNQPSQNDFYDKPRNDGFEFYAPEVRYHNDNRPPLRPQGTADFDEFGNPRRPPEENNGYNNILPARPLATADFDEFGNPRRPPKEKNKFNFNPTLPPNRFNFNPRVNTIVNPADVYKGNPFFKNITIDTTPISITPIQSVPIIPPRNTPEPSVDFSDELDLVTKNSDQPTRPFDDVCGQSITTNHLIFDGHFVPIGAYPWLTAIFYVKSTGLSYICSGSLISNKHVVTAAHCVEMNHKKVAPSKLVLILGKLNIQKWTPVVGEKIVEPASIHVHPDYESLTGDADIAVIELNDVIQFTKYIRPICLWRGDTDLELVVGQWGSIVGWGKDETGVLMTEEPKQTNLPIVSQEKCLASNYQFHYITSNRTFCAGSRNGSGPCNGDSGGGLAIKWNGRWILRGIVSLSISEATTKGCDLSNYVVFCDASKYTNWLLSFLK